LNPQSLGNRISAGKKEEKTDADLLEMLTKEDHLITPSLIA